MFSLLLYLCLFSQNQTDEIRLVNSLLANKTDKYWTLDRSSNRNIVSCASTGLGFVAYSRAAKLGILTKEEAGRRVREGFDSLLECNKENRGWLYHWLSIHGDSVYNHEVSSIDTILFFLGSEQAARELDDKYLLHHIRLAKDKIDVNFMLTKDGYFCHGFVWKDGQPNWFEYNWCEYSEGILIYKYFDLPYKPTKIRNCLPLFVYYFPLMFYDNIEGRQYLSDAVSYQIQTYGRAGFSSCDTLRGYEFFPTDVISPIALYSAGKFNSVARDELAKLKVNSLTPAISIDGKWHSHDDIMIDQAIALLLSKN